MKLSALDRTEGRLEDNLPELITAFWLTQQTGELVVERGKVRKAIYLLSQARRGRDRTVRID